MSKKTKLNKCGASVDACGLGNAVVTVLGDRYRNTLIFLRLLWMGITFHMLCKRFCEIWFWHPLVQLRDFLRIYSANASPSSHKSLEPFFAKKKKHLFLANLQLFSNLVFPSLVSDAKLQNANKARVMETWLLLS